MVCFFYVSRFGQRSIDRCLGGTSSSTGGGGELLSLVLLLLAGHGGNGGGSTSCHGEVPIEGGIVFVAKSE